MFGFLNIKGTALEKAQLEKYMEKIASDNSLKKESDKQTYPIPRLIKNFEFITKVYETLNEHIKIGINIHPAGEWLLDNYYVIEETVKTIQKDLSLNKYKNFVSIADGIYQGYARIYVLAAEMVAYTESNIDEENLKIMLKAYQNKKSLSMDEIWNIGTFIQIAIIENIAGTCEKIYSSQIQKYKVENIVERLVETKPKENLVYKIDMSYKTQKLGYGEIKYPFIEYMSYKLKKAGKKGKAYLEVLEEQVNKMGTTVSEVIKKEHFDIAIRKVSIANSITTIKKLLRTNFLKIFEEINGVEEILKDDPAQVYAKMDYKTKEYYRNIILELSKKTKISEIYIAQKVVELAVEEKSNKNKDLKKTHIGYYLISTGKKQLIDSLNLETRRKFIILDNYNKARIYIYFTFVTALIISILSVYKFNSSANIINTIILAVLIYIPITEIIMQIVQYALNKIIKPKLIPKMDFSEGIPSEDATFVVIPTIIKNKEKVKELISKLEVFYLANESSNLYFALLGDCTSGNKEKEEHDNEVIEEGKKLTEELNKKYIDEKFPKFHFLYRKRRFNNSENCYLGWERKRGLLNQFNTFLLSNDNQDFIVNTIQENYKIKKISPIDIKYIITLDADTDLILNSACKLIGAMAHILNRPEVKEGVVKKGHALIQPKVGINMDVSRKSLFTEIFAGAGGTDFYTNAVSDLYQDNFDEGIFTGKGIYDLKIFSKVLEKEIQDNTVLSHDLLEGSYLRCGLSSDILLMDGYPYKYKGFMSRLSRWIRGDWQIINWLNSDIRNRDGKKKKNPLNFISKFKILDNLRRSLLEISIIIGTMYALLLKFKCNIQIKNIVFIMLISMWIPMILEILNRIIFRRDGQEKQKVFSPIISGYKGSFIRALLTLAFLPDKAYTSINAILKTIYRKYISKKNLLEWITSEEAEKNSKTDYKSYYKNMIPNLIISLIAIIMLVFSNNIFEKTVFLLIAILWGIAPAIACYISKEKKNKPKIDEIKQEDIEYIENIGKSTWKYFKETLIEENNYLPPDNYQENRNNEFINRTSSTNIGLALLAVISSFDLKYESIENTVDLLDKMLNTIEKLSKWNGHLYNWYNISNLDPLTPRYVSTVDSGNFVGYLYVVKQFLTDKKDDENIKNNNMNYLKIENMINQIKDIINKTNFSTLYDYKNDLFSIGFNVEENKLTDSYYDLLASEARQASLIAISKKDIPVKHWSNLSRTLTILNKYKGLISWSGTSFEYLMPNINIPKYKGSLLDESCRFMIMSQIEYCKKLGIPWGISEAAFNLKDFNSNYQYKAFGIPWLGLKRGLSDDTVVSSYGSMLWLPDEPKLVIGNIKRLENEGIIGKYGLYESIDYTRSRLKTGEKNEIVKTFMAHHQGLILLSINNLINENILQERFSLNPEIKAISILLQERMPENVIITKEKKEKLDKIKYKDYESYAEETYNKGIYELNKYNVIANENYTVVMNEKGESFSKYNNIYINRYKETADVEQGIFFYLKNIQTKRIWTSNYMNYLEKPDKYDVQFSPDSIKIKRVDGNIETTTKVTVDINEPVEIRNIEIKNNGVEDEILEITSSFEPIISKKEQDIAHQAFNNLFLRYEVDESNSLIVERKNREQNVENLFLGANLYTEDETIGELEYEIDKEKYVGRGNVEIPQMVKNSKPFSKNIGLVTDPIIALKRTMKIKANDKISLTLILGISKNKKEVLEYIKKYSNNETIKKAFNLAKAKAGEEIRYLGVKGKDIQNYKKVMSLIINQNYTKKEYISKFKEAEFLQENLWKFGISGDLPIILVKIKDVNDIYVVQEIIKAYEFLRVKNIYTDLVIMDEERYSYNLYVQEAIENSILNEQLSYLKNIKSGIFVINSSKIDKEDCNLINFRANIIIDSSLGNLENQLSEIEENYISNIKNIGTKEATKIIVEDEIIRNDNLSKKESIENIKYYNEYGAFSDNGKEYFIKINSDNNLPTTWSHVIANEKFGTIVTEGMGGYTWKSNSRLNRISSWNNNPSQDIPSEIVYLKDEETGKYWSVGSRPTPDKNDYYITYGFGYAKYEHYCLGINQELDVFVPNEECLKINILSLKNTTPNKKKLKLLYYIKTVLGDDETKTNGYLYTKKENNVVYCKNLYNTENKSEIAYISSSENIKSFTGNKNFFIGKNGTIVNPEAINKISLDNESGLGLDSCMAIEIEIELEPYQRKEISLMLGEEEKNIQIKDIAYKYSNIINCKEELNNVKQKWFSIIDKLQIKTPVESMNIILNGWLVYQTLASRLYGRTGYYQSGGAFGFRDQLQDTLGLKYINDRYLKNQIIKNSTHQFIEGDVEHWWHDETKRGIRTKFSDDLLWLAYATVEYIKITGDYEILNIKTKYKIGNQLKRDEIEKYDIYKESNEESSIYEHCMKAIERSINFGENGLPKIGCGDWNDGMSNVGVKGKGESVWLGFFLYYIISEFIPIIKRKDEEKAKYFEKINEELKRALNKNAWDGRWYKRAFSDDGDVLGSIENEECRIDSIAQSWSVISNAGDNDKKFISMESLENHLVDRENAVIKLLDPPFDKSKLNPGYIKAYLPGVRENGGQYTHAAVWTIIAEAMLGFGEKAVEFFRLINPIEHSRTKEGAQKYKVEPYVIAADIYGSSNLAGRGGWTWYTGSSGWMYNAGIEYILGLKIENKILKMNPVIPKDWKEFSIRYRNGESVYNIKVTNPNKKNFGVEKFFIDGKEEEKKELKIIDDGKIHEIEIVM